MKKRFAVLSVSLVAVLVLCAQLARALAGPGPDDPQDSLPAWSANGVGIAFERSAAGRTTRVLAMTAGGRSVHFVGDGTVRGWLPGTEHVLVQVDEQHTLLETDRFDSPPLVAFLGTDAAASPDGARVAYLRGGVLYAARADGTGERPLAAGVSPPPSDVVGPVWSPDGTRIVIASGSSLLLVQADGSGSRALTEGTNPSWSPDGSTIAFEHDAQIRLIGADAANERGIASGRYPQFSPVSNTLAYISDRQHVRGGATQYQFALYTQPLGGVAHKLVDDVHPYSPARWSPTAALIAVSAGRECRRWGIYVVRADVGSQPHRRSNICRFDGTSGSDTIRGSQYFDIVNGRGGDDVIRGNGGSDKLSGGNGDDTILAGAGNDFVLAGPGDDRIFGGDGNDTIIGGNGRDRIDCGAGVDTVEGAGPRDRIARSCERIRH